MSIKKYRLCLMMVAIILTVVAALSVYYLIQEEKEYNDGLLVQKEWVLEEEMA